MTEPRTRIRAINKLLKGSYQAMTPFEEQNALRAERKELVKKIKEVAGKKD